MEVERQGEDVVEVEMPRVDFEESVEVLDVLPNDYLLPVMLARGIVFTLLEEVRSLALEVRHHHLLCFFGHGHEAEEERVLVGVADKICRGQRTRHLAQAALEGGIVGCEGKEPVGCFVEEWEAFEVHKGGVHHVGAFLLQLAKFLHCLTQRRVLQEVLPLGIHLIFEHFRRYVLGVYLVMNLGAHPHHSGDYFVAYFACNLLCLAGEDESQGDNLQGASESGHLGERLQAVGYLRIEGSALAVDVECEQDGHEGAHAYFLVPGGEGVHQQHEFFDVESLQETEKQSRHHLASGCEGHLGLKEQCLHFRGILCPEGVGCPYLVEEQGQRHLVVGLVARLALRQQPKANVVERILPAHRHSSAHGEEGERRLRGHHLVPYTIRQLIRRGLQAVVYLLLHRVFDPLNAIAKHIFIGVLQLCKRVQEDVFTAPNDERMHGFEGVLELLAVQRTDDSVIGFILFLKCHNGLRHLICQKQSFCGENPIP